MINDGFMIAEVIFRHVFCRKTAKNGVMIVLLMRQHNLSFFNHLIAALIKRRSCTGVVPWQGRVLCWRQECRRFCRMTALPGAFAGRVLIQTAWTDAEHMLRSKKMESRCGRARLIRAVPYACGTLPRPFYPGPVSARSSPLYYFGN